MPNEEPDDWEHHENWGGMEILRHVTGSFRVSGYQAVFATPAGARAFINAILAGEDVQHAEKAGQSADEEEQRQEAEEEAQRRDQAEEMAREEEERSGRGLRLSTPTVRWGRSR